MSRLRRVLSFLLILCLLLTGCASRQITGRGEIALPSAVTPESSAASEKSSAEETLPEEELSRPEEGSSAAGEDAAPGEAAPAPEPSSTEKSSEASASQKPSSQEPSSQEPSSQEPSSQEPSSEEPSTEEPSSQDLSSGEIPSEEPSSQETPDEGPSSEESLPEEEPSSEEPSSQEILFMEEPSSEEDPPSEEPTSEEEEIVIGISEDPEPEKPVTRSAPVYGEVRGVWISYLDLLEIAQNRSGSQFTASVSSMFDRIRDYGLNTVYVQVRPFGDALYRSSIFPWSYVLTGTEGADPGYDPLGIMVDEAHARGLRIEAWVNPYRVRTQSSNRTLSAANPAVQAVNSGDDLAVYYQGGIFYNPASQAARDLITRGVEEILQNYRVDGVHFDDYFYPTTGTAFDSAVYASYVNGGGNLSLGDWRRENVNKLLRQVSSAVSSYGVPFGVSPQANLSINYDAQYADISRWISEGLVDYICPQIYYGFSHSTQSFSSYADQWSRLVSGSGIDLYIGLAAYKCGTADNYAGEGKNEWIQNSDILSRMVSYCRGLNGYDGFLLYRYASFFTPAASVSDTLARERENLADIL